MVPLGVPLLEGVPLGEPTKLGLGVTLAAEDELDGVPAAEGEAKGETGAGLPLGVPVAAALPVDVPVGGMTDDVSLADAVRDTLLVGDGVAEGVTDDVTAALAEMVAGGLTATEAVPAPLAVPLAAAGLAGGETLLDVVALLEPATATEAAGLALEGRLPVATVELPPPPPATRVGEGVELALPDAAVAMTPIEGAAEAEAVAVTPVEGMTVAEAVVLATTVGSAEAVTFTLGMGITEAVELTTGWRVAVAMTVALADAGATKGVALALVVALADAATATGEALSVAVKAGVAAAAVQALAAAVLHRLTLHRNRCVASFVLHAAVAAEASMAPYRRMVCPTVPPAQPLVDPAEMSEDVQVKLRAKQKRAPATTPVLNSSPFTLLPEKQERSVPDAEGIMVGQDGRVCPLPPPPLVPLVAFPPPGMVDGRTLMLGSGVRLDLVTFMLGSGVRLDVVTFIEGSGLMLASTLPLTPADRVGMGEAVRLKAEGMGDAVTAAPLLTQLAA